MKIKRFVISRIFLLFILKGGVFNLTSESFVVKFNGKCFRVKPRFPGKRFALPAITPQRYRSCCIDYRVFFLRWIFPVFYQTSSVFVKLLNAVHLKTEFL